MIQLFAHPRVPDDTAIAVALVGPARLVRGKDKAAAVELIEFDSDTIDLGQGAARVRRIGDDLDVDYGLRHVIYNPDQQRALASEGRTILSRWPSELTYPLHYLGCSYDLGYGADPRAVVDRSWHCIAVSKTVLCNDEQFIIAGEKLFNWEVHDAAKVRTDSSGEARVNGHVSTKFGPTVSPCIIVDLYR